MGHVLNRNVVGGVMTPPYDGVYNKQQFVCMLSETAQHKR